MTPPLTQQTGPTFNTMLNRRRINSHSFKITMPSSSNEAGPACYTLQVRPAVRVACAVREDASVKSARLSDLVLVCVLQLVVRLHCTVIYILFRIYISTRCHKYTCISTSLYTVLPCSARWKDVSQLAVALVPFYYLHPMPMSSLVGFVLLKYALCKYIYYLTSFFLDQK